MSAPRNVTLGKNRRGHWTLDGDGERTRYTRADIADRYRAELDRLLDLVGDADYHHIREVLDER